MISSSSVTKLNVNKNDFILGTLEYNLKVMYSNMNIAHRLFKETSGLMDFAAQISCIDNISIYKKDVIINDRSFSKFFAIDASGLSHGYIIGPEKEFVTPKTSLSLPEVVGGYDGLRMTYGRTNYEQYKAQYECVDRFDSDNNKHGHISIEEVRNNYLPLSNLASDYVKASLDIDIKKYGPLIYHNSSYRSFHLPFVGLIIDYFKNCSNELNLKVYVSENCFSLKTDFINRSRWTKQRDVREYWEGEISYTTFEIEKASLVKTETEYLG